MFDTIFYMVMSSLGIYGLIVAFMYFFQRHLLYHPNGMIPDLSNYALSESTQEILIPSHDHLLLPGWYCPLKTKQQPFIIFFHGNAGHIGERADWLRFFRDQGFGFLIVSYRYNAGNRGAPSEENLIKDGQSIINWVRERGVDSEDIILYGESLGSGLAISLGQNNITKAVILEGGFSSITDVAADKYKFLPAKWLLKDHFNNQDLIENVIAPVLIMHGEKDKTVPIKFAKKLYENANPDKDKFVIFPDAHHVDLREYGAERELLKFLKEI